MQLSKTLLAAATVATFGLASTASAQIFSDTFDRTNGSGDANGFANGTPNDSDWGSNDNGLGGTEVQTYTFDESRGGGAQQTTNGSVAQFVAGGVQVELDLAPLAPVGYTVAFDFQRAAGGTAFVGMALGLDDTDLIENTGGFNANTFLFADAANGADGAILFDAGAAAGGVGGVQVFEAGVQVQDIDEADGYTDDEAVNSVVITVDAPTGYGAGSAGVLSVSINGGASITEDILFDGVSSGFLSFYSPAVGDPTTGSFTNIDNLVVTALPIPEPATLGLLSVAGLGLMRRRR
ncbi:MAG: PEP-CTERM sorting domain-containing protein [Planctomycetota bacterium]